MNWREILKLPEGWVEFKTVTEVFRDLVWKQPDDAAVLLEALEAARREIGYTSKFAVEPRPDGLTPWYCVVDQGMGDPSFSGYYVAAVCRDASVAHNIARMLNYATTNPQMCEEVGLSGWPFIQGSGAATPPTNLPHTQAVFREGEDRPVVFRELQPGGLQAAAASVKLGDGT